MIWLSGCCEFTLYTSKKGGRPSLFFGKSSESSKQRKTADIRAEHTPDLLTYAAQMSLRAEGKTMEADVIKKVSTVPTYAKDCIDLNNHSKIKKLTPSEALSILIEASLSRTQYNFIRDYVKDIKKVNKLGGATVR